MVIKIEIDNPKVQAPPPTKRFTLKDVEELFSNSKNWKEFYLANEQKLWESNVDVYSWPVYPLHTKDDIFYRCILHDTIEVKVGPDRPPLTFFFRNIHYSEFISHCIYYKPEEHKQYIIEKLKLDE